MIGEAIKNFNKNCVSMNVNIDQFLEFVKGQKIQIDKKDFDQGQLVMGKDQHGKTGLVPISYLKFQNQKPVTYFTQQFDNIYRNEQQIVPQLIQDILPTILNNIEDVGIFRLEGDSKLVKKIQEYQFSPKFAKQNVHTCCHIFKQFYSTQLQEYRDIYLGDIVEKLVKTYSENYDQNKTIQQYAQYICTIPNQFMFINFRLILYVLNRVAQKCLENKMNSGNLADIFSIWLFNSMETQYKSTLTSLIEFQDQIEQQINDTYPLNFDDQEIFTKELTYIQKELWKQVYRQQFQVQKGKLTQDIYNNSGGFISGQQGMEIELLDEKGDYYIAEYQNIRGYIYKKYVQLL